MNKKGNLHRISLIKWSLRNFLAADWDSADVGVRFGVRRPDPGQQPWVLCEGDGAHRDGPTADEFKPMGVLPEVSGNHPPLPKIFSGIFSGGLFRFGAI